MAIGVLFSKSQADAIAAAESLVGHINSHIGKLNDDPDGPDANHWRSEINAGIQRVERQIRHMGKKTADKWKKAVDDWRKAIPEGGQ